MIKLAIVILILAFGYSHGGWWGAFSMLLILSVICAPFAGYGGEHKAQQPQHRQDPDFSMAEQTNVRKGRRVDPTRPTEDDYAAMITNNYGKRK